VDSKACAELFTYTYTAKGRKQNKTKKARYGLPDLGFSDVRNDPPPAGHLFQDWRLEVQQHETNVGPTQNSPVSPTSCISTFQHEDEDTNASTAQ